MSDRDPRDEQDIMLANPREENAFRGLVTQDVIPPGMQLTQRQVSDLFGAVQVAQMVPVPRNVENLMKKMTVLAAQFGDKYVYSWDVKKKGGGVDTIEGGTVDLAYDLAREYGNNNTDVRALDYPTYIEFYARFTDLETGYSTMRSFRQRKSQSSGGRMDADRQLDITYQIGQSKAIRNVTLKALSSFAEYCIEEAKRGMYDKIKKDPEKYIGAIERGMEKFDIDLKDVERQANRTKANWTVRDIANIFARLKSVDEGMASAREAFPKDGGQIEKPTTSEKDDDEKQEQKTTAGDGEGAAKAEARSGGVTGKSPPPDQAKPNADGLDPPATMDRRPKPQAAEAKAEAKPEPKVETPKEKPKAAARPKGLLFDQE